MIKTKIQLRRVGGEPWSKIKEIPLTPSTLRRLGYALVKALKIESAKDFAKRGWTGEDPMGGKPIWESFSFSVKDQNVLVYSTFYGMKELSRGDIPARKMTWLTQQAKNDKPSLFPLTPREKELGMRRTGKPKNGKRLPLIVPLEVGGEVIFRTAPFRFADAWVHPGIAKFTFFERAIRKGREACMEIIMEEVTREILKGDPSR